MLRLNAMLLDFLVHEVEILLMFSQGISFVALAVHTSRPL
jgi:hypothetical protein